MSWCISKDIFINRAASSEFVSSSIPSWQILTVHAQPFKGARDLAFCLKVPLDSLPVWASSGSSGETARMRRLAWTFAARIGDKYQIRLTRPNILKTVFMMLGSRQQLYMRTEQIALYIKNEVVQNADQQKLLGIIIDKNLNWDKQIDAVCLNILTLTVLHFWSSCQNILILQTWNYIIIHTFYRLWITDAWSGAVVRKRIH